jgi:hypothetical protein
MCRLGQGQAGLVVSELRKTDFFNQPMIPCVVEMENAYTQWTAPEEGLMMLRLAEGKTIYDIATEFSRTPGAIQSRQKAMALRLFKQGRSFRDITILLRMTYPQLEDLVRQLLSPN